MHEQLSLFVRYIDLQKQKLVEEFLEMKRIVGHPTAVNMLTAVMGCIQKEITSDSLPAKKFVELTTDHGASVMISESDGLYGNLKQTLNPKLFLTHCPPHSVILASKASQKVLPGDIEKTVSDMFFLRTALSTMINSISSKNWLNHIVRMLLLFRIIRYGCSLSDCISRLVKLLP